MNQLTFRQATRYDVPIILDFINQLAIYEKKSDQVVATNELLEFYLFDEKKAEVIIASIDNKDVGFALFFTTFSTFLSKPGIYLEDLFVKEDYRNQGIGSEILKKLASITVERGYKRLEWSCLTWNQPSIDFYLSKNAEIKDEWLTFRLDGENLLALANKLQ